MTNEQEIRAKALEIAVAIIGRKTKTTRTEIEEDTDELGVTSRITAVKDIPISLLEHYQDLATEIEQYIHGA